MKTLIIADLHNKVHWVEKCIEEVNPDLTVFLGDYFDSFDETPECARQTAQWLKKSINQPNRVHLLGNHDMPYRFPINFHLLCPGFTHEKSIIINEVLDSGELWRKTKSFYWVDGWLLSHAGINLHLLHPIKGFDLDDLLKFEENSLAKCSAGISTPMFGCGRSRGGNNKCGGITWQDFDADFTPLEGINQIVGHTPHSKVRTKFILEGSSDEDILECDWEEYMLHYETKPKKSLNLGIDTHRQYFAILENGKVQIHQNTFALQEDFSK